jgi:hypothetical protein
MLCARVCGCGAQSARVQLLHIYIYNLLIAPHIIVNNSRNINDTHWAHPPVGWLQVNRPIGQRVARRLSEQKWRAAMARRCLSWAVPVLNDKVTTRRHAGLDHSDSECSRGLC